VGKHAPAHRQSSSTQLPEADPLTASQKQYVIIDHWFGLHSLVAGKYSSSGVQCDALHGRASEKRLAREDGEGEVCCCLKADFAL
jgi:hypothetical protein